MEEHNLNKILELLKSKSSMKQDVFHKTIETFKTIKSEAKSLSEKIRPEIAAHDKRVTVEFRDRGEFYFELKFAGDLLIVGMHTNVFEFEPNHFIHKSKYVREDPTRSYCGIITVYNFLSDSFKYNRQNDLGYPIARIFVNKDAHYFAEGKKAISIRHNQFETAVINQEQILHLLEDLVIYSLDFDLFAPPFQNMPEMSVYQVNESASYLNLTTAKRLGFRFHFEDERDFR
jgi:hypothetical protein